MTKALRLNNRTLTVRRDPIDFRDKLFETTLVEVPRTRPLKHYLKAEVPILDQGEEGACTGFGLATVAHYLLRSLDHDADPVQVSPRMFYEMAKRYDEWPGEDYEGSSARGAMKGWQKHGVCALDAWPYSTETADSRLTNKRSQDANKRPLGAYYRVNHLDLVAMHCAIAEVGVLYATADVHSGWDAPDEKGRIPYQPDYRIEGGHAFAVVAYDEHGFWIQNSWGPDWGHGGFAQISYDDWLANATDVWVARLGAPIKLKQHSSIAVSHAAIAGQSVAYAFSELQPHIISLGNNGKLRGQGTFGTAPGDVEHHFDHALEVLKTWDKPRLLLFAHGGLTAEQAAIQRLADYRPPLMKSQVYPMTLIWKTDYWTTLGNMIADLLPARHEHGRAGGALDFMYDRLDDTLEPIARAASGKAQWDEMKENALLASLSPEGGLRLVAARLAALKQALPELEIHLVNHSAGSILQAHLVQLLTSEGPIGACTPVQGQSLTGETGYGLRLDSCTMWAPACTTALFKQTYLPAVKSGALARLNLFTLTDQAEQEDDCAGLYHKSLLYLVSNAFEDFERNPRRDGTPILGMQKWIELDPELRELFVAADPAGPVSWVRSPNTEARLQNHATSRSHGGFDEDPATLLATLGRVLQDERLAHLDAQGTELVFHRTAKAVKNRHRKVQARR